MPVFGFAFRYSRTTDRAGLPYNRSIIVRARAVCLIVLDSAGIGDAPDAAAFGDEGSATLPNISRAVGGLSRRNRASWGLGNIAGLEGVAPAERPRGAYGS